MNIPFFRHFNPVTQMFGAFTLFFTGMLLSQLIFKLMVIFIWKSSGSAEIDNESLLTLSRISYTIGVLLVFIAPATIFRKYMEFEGQDYLRVRRAPAFKNLALMIFLFAGCFVVSNFLFYINQELDPSAISTGLGEFINRAQETDESVNRQMFVEPSLWKYLLSLFTVAGLTAIGEEFFFRGIILRLFVKMLRNVHAAVIFSALVFALIHVNYYGMLSRIFMGIVLAYIYLCTGNIWYSIVFHFLNNAIIVTSYWLVSMQYNIEPISEFGYEGYGRWVALALLAVLTVWALMQLKKRINPGFVQEIKDY